MDGKTVRGATDATGNQLHLFAALVHGEATVIAQHRVDSKTTEVTGLSHCSTRSPSATTPNPTSTTTTATAATAATTTTTTTR